MSVRLMSMVFEASEISSTQKLVLLALADHAADDGTSIYPSIETICYKTCLSQAAVRKALKELRTLSIIRITRKFTSRMPNKYAINIDALTAIKRVSPDSTQESGLSPRSTLTITKKHPRLSPRSTDPSLTINESSGDTPIEKPAASTRDIQNAYLSCVSYPVDWKKNEGHAAKWLAENGYTAQDVIGCYKSMAVEDFWKGKAISLSSVKNRIGAWREQNGQRRVIKLTGVVNA